MLKALNSGIIKLITKYIRSKERENRLLQEDEGRWPAALEVPGRGTGWVYT